MFEDGCLLRYELDGDDDIDLIIGASLGGFLGHRYRAKFRKFYKETYDIPGGHHLSQAAAKKIMTEIAPMLIARFKSKCGMGHILDQRKK